MVCGRETKYDVPHVNTTYTAPLGLFDLRDADPGLTTFAPGLRYVARSGLGIVLVGGSFMTGHRSAKVDWEACPSGRGYPPGPHYTARFELKSVSTPYVFVLIRVHSWLKICSTARGDVALSGRMEGRSLGPLGGAQGWEL